MSSGDILIANGCKRIVSELLSVRGKSITFIPPVYPILELSSF